MYFGFSAALALAAQMSINPIKMNAGTLSDITFLIQLPSVVVYVPEGPACQLIPASF
jgi:hypothetical protein